MVAAARDLLHGAVDLHIHTKPDTLPRLMDDLELAMSARDAGMAAIVLKSHHMLTADRAQIAEKLSTGVRVFGGLALNGPACGGLNPDAVRVAIRMGARILWLPTVSAANHIERTRHRVTGNLGVIQKGFSSRPVHVLDGSGSVVPDLAEILSLVADADIILATGHLSVPEVKAVVRAAKAAGVRKILANHVELWLTAMSVDDQRELAAQGVMLERCIRSVTSNSDPSVSFRAIAEQIRAVGAESTVMATDYGQPEELPPHDGMLRFIERMLEHGIPAEDVETMVRVNPRRLLGI